MEGQFRFLNRSREDKLSPSVAFDALLCKILRLCLLVLGSYFSRRERVSITGSVLLFPLKCLEWKGGTTLMKCEHPIRKSLFLIYQEEMHTQFVECVSKRAVREAFYWRDEEVHFSLCLRLLIQESARLPLLDVPLPSLTVSTVTVQEHFSLYISRQFGSWKPPVESRGIFPDIGDSQLFSVSKSYLFFFTKVILQVWYTRLSFDLLLTQSNWHLTSQIIK